MRWVMIAALVLGCGAACGQQAAPAVDAAKPDEAVSGGAAAEVKIATPGERFDPRI